jgi:hypothetical protein
MQSMEQDMSKLSKDEVMKKAHERGENVDSLMKLVNKLPMKSNGLLKLMAKIKATGREVDTAEAEYMEHTGHPQYGDQLVAAVKKNATVVEEFLELLVSLRKEYDKSKNVENLNIWYVPTYIHFPVPIHTHTYTYIYIYAHPADCTLSFLLAPQHLFFAFQTYYALLSCAPL